MGKRAGTPEQMEGVTEAASEFVQQARQKAEQKEQDKQIRLQYLNDLKKR